MKTPIDGNWTDWTQACRLIESEIPKTSYLTWIAPLVPLAMEDHHLYVQVPSVFVRNFVEGRYVSILTNALSQVSGQSWEITLLLEDEAAKLTDSMTAVPDKNASASAQAPMLMLNPKNTFDTFVIGNSNRFAHAAALAVAEAPAQAYNPLFIYGGAGLGKTHLIQAIGHFIREQNPAMKIVYVTSEMFMNELINAIKSGTNMEFRNRYRNADVLIIDDIQFIAGKDSTEEELFHTFNTLREAQKQIVLTSDKPPKEMKQLTQRLRSRFEWGLIADIQPPDLETRIAILRKKAEAEHVEDLPDDAMEFIATNSENNIRELEGTLTRVLAYSRLSRRPITMDLVHEALKDMLDANAGKRATPENIMRLVCDRYGISMEDFLGRRRNQEIAYPRKIAMYLVREMTDISLSSIGEAFGGRDHTTVLHAWRTISEDMASNAELRALLADIRNQLMDKSKS
jgi:chromosomal replication initiator protein